MNKTTSFLKSFIPKVSSYNAVEGVLATCYHFNNQQPLIDLFVIYNESESYSQLLGIDASQDLQEVNELVDDTRQKLSMDEEVEISVGLRNRSHFTKEYNGIHQFISSAALLRGELLFDRFGELGKLKALLDPDNYSDCFDHTCSLSEIGINLEPVKRKIKK